MTNETNYPVTCAACEQLIEDDNQARSKCPACLLGHFLPYTVYMPYTVLAPLSKTPGPAGAEESAEESWARVRQELIKFGVIRPETTTGASGSRRPHKQGWKR